MVIVVATESPMFEPVNPRRQEPYGALDAVSQCCARSACTAVELLSQNTVHAGIDSAAVRPLA